VTAAARVVEADVCIIGAGISSAMVAERVAEDTDARIVVVEAGNSMFNFEERFERRERFLEYGENPWPDDHIQSQFARGIQSRSMCVGGLALHWGGVVPRFTPEDFRQRSQYGVGTDWPIDYDDLEPYYAEAEERLGVAGEQGPGDLDLRSGPYPMPPMPLTYNLERLKEWAEKSGIPFWANPVAKNTVPYKGRNVCQRCDTCNICPTGAKYSPDFTFRRLLDQGRIELLTRTLVRRLVPARDSDRIEEAVAVDRDMTSDPVRIRARVFVVATGYAWSSHLLLLSANSRFPEGLSNSSGRVGAYITGHRPVSAFAEVPFRMYPGMMGNNSLLSKRFQRPGSLDRYVRHDLRIWDSTTGRGPRLEDDEGRLLLGNSVLEDWRARSATGSARLRAYYDVIPDRRSRISLDGGLRNEWGDPMPRIQFVDAPESVELRPHTEEHIRGVLGEIVAAGGGRILSTGVQDIYDHPSGGCRMGDDPGTSVVDTRGRSHDHENLFVVGAPTAVSAGCGNGTLTFCALALRSAQEVARTV
jgi:quinoprotein glucose dehydrogenase